MCRVQTPSALCGLTFDSEDFRPPASSSPPTFDPRATTNHDHNQARPCPLSLCLLPTCCLPACLPACVAVGGSHSNQNLHLKLFLIHPLPPGALHLNRN
ncbi:hypothetical protein Mp_2g22230 [Marchantia polymorpha subsp. ruderalis]|uniref:Uncharacterized protein n=1 Tax=Marchantia polymorpha TaxID=3197 RepID=A0A2R6WNE6_MARPO|nr:hypothetical protein MARPO_0072s0104 [Marchantia polymorpha]BBN03277.1 hypothetical protein Mp_2g22230 [Marchantia polymorpha subsp. ruderalis]|eukprot:PTQ35371.1 hypothetical protein MARPO_0072s0104 [Marchantia polymorpha]